MYQDLSAARRQRAHKRVAEALEAVGTEDGHLVELAWHWMAATRPTDTTKALYYARRAGDAALAAYAPLDAISWYSQALELPSAHSPSDNREHCALLVGLGTAQRLAGQIEHRQTLLDAAALAQRLGDTELLVTAALAGTRGFAGVATADNEQIDVLKAALAAVGDTDNASKARLLAALVGVTDARDWILRRDLADEAMAIASDLSDQSTILDVFNRCYSPRAQAESLAQRLTETHEAAIMADRLGEPVARYRARYNLVHARMESGDLEEVDRRQTEMRDLVRQTGFPYYQWEQELFRSCRLLLSGDLADADTSNSAALEMGARLGAPEAMGAFGAVLFAIRLQQGRLNEIADLFTQAAADNPAIVTLRAAVVCMYCALGRLDEARVLFETDVVNEFVDFPNDNVWTTAMTLCADNGADLGHKEAAQVLYDRLRPFHDMVAFNNGTVEGAISRSMGRLAHLLGRHEDAESLFQAALSMNERIRAPYWTARTKLDYADLLIDEAAIGDAEKDREMIAQAFDVAQEHGYGALERRAQGLLESLA